MKISTTTFRISFTLVALLAAFIISSFYLSLLAEDNTYQSPPSTPESIKAGEGIFFEYCAGCHGRRADGRGLQSRNLKPKPQNLRNAQFVKYLTNARIYTSLSGGVRGTAMPPFEMTLTPQKRWEVIHYIRSLTADDTISIPNALAHQTVAPNTKNPVAVNEMSIAAGKKLFSTNCANCHGARADGNGIISPNLVPAPRNLVVVTSWGEKPFIDYLNDDRLYDSITNGVPGTSMLPWIAALTDEERWHIINFLRNEAKQEREKPGNQ